MEWFIMAAPVPGPLSIEIGTHAAFLVALAVALAPVLIAARHTFSRMVKPSFAAPRLRVVDGGKQLRPRPA